MQGVFIERKQLQKQSATRENTSVSRYKPPLSTRMSYFDFKQFRIYHDRCAMKVGTDSILLGAWANLEHACRILDIGCGSGLISLMAAQRCNASVTGVEIDPQSATQAKANCAASPFSHRITITETDIRNFNSPQKFDCILSNPPYFEETLLPPDRRRAVARHTAGLKFTTLIKEAKRLMAPYALLQVILPYEAANRLCTIAFLEKLMLIRRTDISTRQGRSPKRSLLCFQNTELTEPAHHDILILTDKNGSRSKEYIRLTKDFYLDPDKKKQQQNH